MMSTRTHDKLDHPVFFLLGAPKSATTALAACFDRHPQVVVSRPKESPFFLAEFDRGLPYYLTRYFPRRHEGDVLCDAGPILMAHWVPKRIQAVAPHARFVIVLRDPVERAFSHWWQRVSLGLEPLSFEDAVADELRENYGQRLQSLEERERFCRIVIDTGYSVGYRHYLYIGHYADHLRRYIDRFGRDRLQILFLNDLEEDPEATMASICSFLEIRTIPGLVPPRANEAHSRVYHRTLSSVARLVQPLRLPASLRRAFRHVLERALARTEGVWPGGLRPPLRPDTRDELSEYFKEHNRALAALLDVPVLPWDHSSAELGVGARGEVDELT
jgi:hypothetical protein